MPVNVRGTVLGVAATRTVTTQYGERDLAEVGLLLEDGGKTSVTLWGDWAATADYLGHGMELLVTAAETSEFDGEQQYATTGESFVVVKPESVRSMAPIVGPAGTRFRQTMLWTRFDPCLRNALYRRPRIDRLQ